VLECILGGYPLVRIIDEYLLEQIVELLVEGIVAGHDVLFWLCQKGERPRGRQKSASN